jgi:DNA polymerase-3 subunit gamma/tau
MEIDAATNTGIDAMRDITSALKYQGFGDSPNKMIILDEVHALSKQAWTALLKSIEEPPPHVFFALCTTDSGKVPVTVLTRCLNYNLKPIRYDDLMDLLEDVADRENLDTPAHILGMIGRACNGSPRQALVMLSMLKDVTDQQEAATLLEQPLEDKEVIDLARLLVKGELDWAALQKTLKSLTESNPESVRIIITHYLNACLMGAKSERDVPKLLDYLYAFSKPCNPTDKMAPILLSFGDCIFK